MPGRQHADKSADVGVPDIAIAIDGDAERPGIASTSAAMPRTLVLASGSDRPTETNRVGDHDPASRRRPDALRPRRIAWIDRNDERRIE